MLAVVHTPPPLSLLSFCLIRTAKKVEVRKIIKIGRPGYRVVKQRDPETGQRSLLFEIQYPEIEQGLQPRHRFMSAFEQKIEAPDKRFQYVELSHHTTAQHTCDLTSLCVCVCLRYLLFAAAPYETIGFKLPAEEIDKSKDKFFSNWDKAKLVFTVRALVVPLLCQHQPRSQPHTLTSPCSRFSCKSTLLSRKTKRGTKNLQSLLNKQQRMSCDTE